MAVIPKRLKAAREEKDLSQEDVAKKLKITSSGYGFYEQGKRVPNINHLMRLVELLDKPITYFLEEESTNGNLAPSEVELLEVYRGLSYTGKEYVLRIAQDFLKREQTN